MKKLGYILLSCIFLSGCLLPGEINKDTVLSETKPVTESFLPVEKETNEGKTQKVREEENGKIQTTKAFTDEVKAELMRKQQNLYCFSMLEITQQNVYVEILYGLENYVEEMEISVRDTAQIDKIFQYVLMDHPEIFYVDGYSFVKYTLGDEVKKITFKGNYLYTPEEKKQIEELIQESAAKMLEKIPADATDYEKVKYVYETTIKNTEYDMQAEDNQNICSVFLNGASVCQGYAKAVQYLLMELNVPASLVIGSVENGEGHAWNLVKVNNQYYHLDATWGDASYLVQQQGNTPIQNTPAINYDYLCVTTEEILRTHSLGELISLPQCNSREDNYYVREGAYFTEVDFEQIEQLIKRYKAEYRENVTLRCADDEVYGEMIEELLNKQKIFRYLDGENNSIFYTDSPEQLSITFWL